MPSQRAVRPNMKHPCPRSSSFPAPPPEHSQGGERIPTGNSGVVVVTLMVLVAAMVTSSVDRRAGAETTAALQEAQEKLVQVTRTQAMGELAATIAHEVNQPLTAIVTNGNFCLRRLESATSNPDEIRGAIIEVVNDGNRASAVISRIRGLLTK